MKKLFLIILLPLLMPVYSYAQICPDTAKPIRPFTDSTDYKYGCLTGIVTDEEGNSIQGATVMIQGTRFGGIAKREGIFKILNVNPGNYNVRIIAVGYKLKELRIIIEAGKVTEIYPVLELKSFDGKKVMLPEPIPYNPGKIGCSTTFESWELTLTPK